MNVLYRSICLIMLVGALNGYTKSYHFYSLFLLYKNLHLNSFARCEINEIVLANCLQALPAFYNRKQIGITLRFGYAGFLKIS